MFVKGSNSMYVHCTYFQEDCATDTEQHLSSFVVVLLKLRPSYPSKCALDFYVYDLYIYSYRPIHHSLA